MKIIGLLGGAGAGKSQVSKYLCEKYGARKYSFAYPLKEIVRRAFDLTEDQVYGSQAAKESIDPRYNVTPRWLLQRLGTEGIRDVLGVDFWWQHCLDRIVEDEPELAVIDDFRFTNEVNGFLSLNINYDPKYPMVHVWRVEAPGPRDTEADQNHQSEAEWEKCPFTNLVKPEEWGLVELYDAADLAAYESGIAPTVAVLA